ncbi:hypothetical protein Bca52824_007521 [Brassica carinata]|uniref:Uncharacterized protein n=1 Tax=Brassica carinata TaxID=52824 RepID=A0A8X7WA34_BRACI|nr:hypothetical protein Bca52824_007521 [Brassica carinata]
MQDEEAVESSKTTCRIPKEDKTREWSGQNRVTGGHGGREVTGKRGMQMDGTSCMPAFTAPPENVRDHVTAATRALTKGDFEKDFEVHIFMNKMMIAEELHANWDQPTRCIVFHDVQHNRFQTFSFQLTEKLDVLAESKERLWRLGPVVAGLDLSKRRRDINQEYAGRGGGGK